ncbi:MAG: hypothetical protein JWR47_3335 [Phenylobacterium sp.]|nr:hypothetical protein [Phenylobacterium sp.]
MHQYFNAPAPKLPVPTRRQALGIGATLVGGALIVGCSPSMIGKAMSVGARTTSAPSGRSSRWRPTAR